MPTVIAATDIDDPQRRVPLHEAQARWVRAAQEVLEETATSWARVIDERQLADDIQKRSGIATRNRRASWLPKVLGMLIMYAHSKEKPQFVSLVVGADGSVTSSYSGVLMLHNLTHATAQQRAEHALHQRFLCYRQCASDVPAGAQAKDLAHITKAAAPAVARGSRAVRATRAQTPQPHTVRAEAAEVRMPVCPTCWLENPPGVACPNCD